MIAASCDAVVEYFASHLMSSSHAGSSLLGQECGLIGSYKECLIPHRHSSLSRILWSHRSIMASNNSQSQHGSNIGSHSSTNAHPGPTSGDLEAQTGNRTQDSRFSQPAREELKCKVCKQQHYLKAQPAGVEIRSPHEIQKGYSQPPTGAAFTCAMPSLEACQAHRYEEAERIVKFFDGLYAFVIGTATLGAGFTFQNIITPLQIPTDQGNDRFKGDIQQILSISWLLFILALASAGTFASIIGYGKMKAEEEHGFGRDHLDDHNTLRWFGFFASAIPVGLLTGAFICLTLVVSAYDGKVGIAALFFTSLFGFIALGSAVKQSPIGSKVS